MSVHGIKVKFLKTELDPEAVEILQPTWVKVYGLPRIVCREEVVRKVATLTGEPLVVDERSLIKSGPVRVKLNCRDPNKLRGFVRILFNTVGHDIRFVSEKYKEKSVHPPPPPDRDEDTREDEEEEEEDSDSDRKHRKRDAKTYSRFDQTMEGEKGGSATGHYSAAGGGQKEAITIGKAVEGPKKATRGG
jgi:hypothetical protein